MPRKLRRKKSTTDAPLQGQGSAPLQGQGSAPLQEQGNISFLTSEIERLKAILVEHGLGELTQLNLRVQDNENFTRRTRSATRTLNAVPTTPNTPRSKGCSCRGNCSNRICGCVKKNVPCAEFCRCGNALCQNQEPDKENIGDPNNQAVLSKEGEESLQKLAALSLKDKKKSSNRQKTAPPLRSNKRDGKPRSIFSPELADDEGNGINEGELANRSLRFDEDSESESSDNNEVFEKREVRKSWSKKEPKSAETTKNVQGRSRREELEVPEVATKLRSLSSGESCSELEGVKKSRNKRSVSVDGTSTKTAYAKPGKTLAALMNGLKPFRRPFVAKTISRVNSGADSENSEVGTSKKKVDERKITEKKAPVEVKKIDKGKSRKKMSKNLKTKEAEDDRANSMETGEASNSTENDTKKQTNRVAGKKDKKTVRMEKQDITDKLNEQSGDGNRDKDEFVTLKLENEDIETSEPSHRAEENPAEPEQSIAEISSDSGGHSEPSTSGMCTPGNPATGNRNFLHPEEDDNFDPMKPRHKLSRSPIGSCNESVRYHQTLDLSERPLPIPLQEEPVVELPPPEELQEAVVDWEKHQAERVHCRKCGRGFYPYRIKKHESSCHKV